MSNFPQHLVFFSFLLVQATFVYSQLSCPPSYCGNLQIKFPLWLKSSSSSNSTDSYCGFPDLGVDCENGTAIVHAGNDTYLVESSGENGNGYTFKDRDLLGSTCPRAKHNLTLVKDQGFPLLLGGNLSIFFYFNCTSKEDRPLHGYIPLDPCIKNEYGKQSFAVLSDRKLKSGKDEGLECEDIVESPVKNFEAGNVNGWFAKALQGGFEMVVNADMERQCRDCERRNGTCTYVKRPRPEEGYEFKCTNEGTSKSRGINLGRKIAIGVSSGIGGVLLAGGLIFFILWKRRQTKKLSDPPKLLSWTNSSEKSLKDIENSVDSMGPPFFRYEELHDATNGFSPSNELGDGGFGTVYKGKLKDGRIVAVKRLYENNFKRVEQFLNEAAILNRLRHPNLVSLYGCTSRHSRELLLVYEFIPNGTVADHLHGSLASRHELTWPLRFRIALETATALAYLHAAEPQIIHRDVKTTNILLDANFHVKVADFGLSRLFPLDVTHVSTAPQGTPGYVDPEYHQCYQLTDKSDVYSFGVVLVELISSMPAVDITRRRNEINLSNLAISKIQSGQLEEIVDPQLGFKDDLEVRRTVEVVAELAFRCLQGEKEMRPSMEDIVEALVSARNGGVRERDEMKEKKMDEMGLLNAVGAPPSPNSVTYKWSSRVTTPNASQ